MPQGSPFHLLDDLTWSQQEAVTHFEGPLLILAGAGSGKTRVITRRVAWLLSQGVRPSNILAITFTNKAAGEMKQRVDALVPGNRVWVSTFHSLGARLLRQYGERIGLDRNFTIYDMDDRNKIVKQALDAAGMDNVKFTPDRIGGAISKAKNQLLPPDKYAQTGNDFFTNTVAQVYAVYQKKLRDANGLDFDDLLYIPALALKLDPELRTELDARFKFVLIDEYQDTNGAQYQIAKSLSVDHRNICVVGDPDQCLPAGTLIQTPRGPRAVETFGEGDEVLTCAGSGKVIRQAVSAVMVNPHHGGLVKVTLDNGTVLCATSNHVCFARLAPEPKRRGSKRRRMRLRPMFIDSRQEAGAAAFHGWEYEPLPEPTSYTTGLIDPPEFEESPALKLLRGTSFRCIRAGNLCPGLLVPVYEHGRLVEAEIVNVEWEVYEGRVYDLTVPETHNFIANGVAVHNSIYKWRGSDIRNIMDFERDYPDARVITLDKNYRSTPAILRAASAVIEHNKQRRKKSLVTDNADGEPVRVLTFDTGLDEATLVVRRIKEAVQAGKYKYRDVAVFVRMNALTRALEAAFVHQGVPFQIVKGLAFFDRKENRDVLAYLRLLVNPADNISFLRAVNEPARGIGKVSLEHLQSYAEAVGGSLLEAAGNVAKIPAIKGKARDGLRSFHALMGTLRAMVDQPPEDVIAAVLDKSGYRDMLKSTGDDEDLDRLANVEEMITSAKQYVADDGSRTTREFLEQITLASDVDSWDEQQDHVSVMTLHAAKGLEFPVVYVIAMEQGILPGERSLNREEDVEEERRVAFVGITRAMKELYLTHARLRDFRGQTLYAIPSMFLEELPKEVVQVDLGAHGGRSPAQDAFRGGPKAATSAWADTGIKPLPPPVPYSVTPSGAAADYEAGQIVQHDQYGIGTVTEVGGYGALRKIRIRFAVGGEKTFIADKVKLKVVTKKPG
jgi:superfamily I DNA/RNA helicase